jgi:pyruvate dehydrogenase E2 component (dihydrolipoamide acetyltransferase)
MVRSLAEIPQILVSRQIDVTKLSVRSEGITFTHLIIAKVAVALEKHSSLRTITDGRRYRVTPVSVAVAMDSPSGLVAPVLRGVDLQSVGSIANRVNDFRRRAEQRALRSEELRGGPFALTNLGMFGVDQFSPFVFYGQTAVLAVGRAAVGSSANSRAWFSLASDHRVVDGAEAARFLETLEKLLLT